MEFLIQLAFAAILLGVGLGAGRIAERKHFASLARREQDIGSRFVVTDLKRFPGGAAGPATLVAGHACISSDYFKSFVASLRKLIGGELRSYESLMQRARREAVMRMLEEAHRLGYDAVCNVRLEGADIGGATLQRKGGVVSVSVHASGTAYRLADPSLRASLASPMASQVNAAAGQTAYRAVGRV